MSEALGRLFEASWRAGRLLCIQIIGGVDLCTHQQFVDDTMILEKGKLNEAKEIKRTLHSYGLASAEMVNGEKSEIFLLNMTSKEESRIASFLGYRIG